MGFCQSSPLLQRTNSLTPVGHGEMMEIQLPACSRLCVTAPAGPTEWDGANQQQERYWEPRVTRFVKLTKINKPLFPMNCLPTTHTIAFAIMAIKIIISASYHYFSLSSFSARNQLYVPVSEKHLLSSRTVSKSSLDMLKQNKPYEIYVVRRCIKNFFFAYRKSLGK